MMAMGRALVLPLRGSSDKPVAPGRGGADPAPPPYWPAVAIGASPTSPPGPPTRTIGPDCIRSASRSSRRSRGVTGGAWTGCGSQMRADVRAGPHP
jgi:hypothetical protein